MLQFNFSHFIIRFLRKQASADTRHGSCPLNKSITYTIIQINQIMSKKDSLIGLSPNCQCKCLGSARQSFDWHPHAGKHEVLSEKEMLKKLTTSKISAVGCELQQLTDSINKQFSTLLGRIQEYQKECLLDVKLQYFKTIVLDDIPPDQKLIETFVKLSNFQYQELSCSQINLAFASIKNLKEIQLNNKKSSILKKLKSTILAIVTDSLKALVPTQESSFSSQEGKKSLMYESQVKQFKLNSTQSSSNSVKDTSFSLSNSEISINFSSNSLNQSKLTFIDYLNGQIDDQDSDEDYPIKPEQVPKKDQHFSKKGVLGMFDSDGENTPTNSSLKKDQKKQPKKLDKKQQKKEEKKDDKKQQKKEEKKDDKKQQKKEEKKEEKKYQKKPSRKQSGNEKVDQINPNLKSYVREETKYYVRVSHLQKPLYREEKATFNIKVKVVKIIIFRLNSDRKENKTYKKVKFVAGDETGIAVCYTNYMPEIKKGAYLILNECNLQKFNSSYEILSSKCLVDRQKQQFEANLNKSISRFDCLDTLVYSMQKFDSRWPSILGIIKQKPEEYKEVRIIVQLSEIIYENGFLINCHLSDGTGTIYAVLDQRECPLFKLGFVYFFKKVTPSVQVHGNNPITFLELGIKNMPIEMPDLSYNLETAI